jgi:hypothetical protein
MSRLNLEPLMTFSDGSFLAISTECSKEGEFSCAVYSVLETGDHTAFRNITNHLVSASTCLTAQEQAYITEEASLFDLAWAASGRVSGRVAIPLHT